MGQGRHVTPVAMRWGPVFSDTEYAVLLPKAPVLAQKLGILCRHRSQKTGTEPGQVHHRLSPSMASQCHCGRAKPP